MGEAQKMSLAFVATALNATVAGPYAWVRKLAHGTTLSAVASRYSSAALILIQSLGLSCHWPGGREERLCDFEHECFIPNLHYTFNSGHAELQRTARGAVARLCHRGASAALVALVAAIDSQATFYPAVTTECISFASSMEPIMAADQDKKKKCFEAHDMGIACAHSLFQVGALSAAALNDFGSIMSEGYATDWTFVGKWGPARLDILGELLRSVASRGDSVSDDDVESQQLSMAEVGVFLANTSTSLLKRFPKLNMLLVDPYHLHTTTHLDEFQMIEEFYVSPQATFELAAKMTQPFRNRATHILQTSKEAAHWVRRESMDLVFLDGDHRLESVASDIQAWWPTVRPGGILAGHDFALSFPGVVEAVARFVVPHGLRLFIAPEVWFVVKPVKTTEAGDSSEVSAGATTADWYKHDGNCYL
eukprot:TRINITY_DN9622_c0_g1_i1.p1 TRINITY_DN9622_c0_g1~~TRINITY_DN9622_c0_g1_i1.p1  ORF type:complete len:421 (-),score=57.98 TRINITY_DN9622_c0_g1_i1:82-1344(-)